MRQALAGRRLLCRGCLLVRKSSAQALARPSRSGRVGLYHVFRVLTGMSSIEATRLQCPYCWEVIEVLVDCSVPEQDYVEDCSVCCRPIAVVVSVRDGAVVEVSGRAEND
jgi:hypothetical protein